MALKEDLGSGVDEWEKQCGCCLILWSLCMFGCISGVVVGVLVLWIAGIWGCVKLV
jgi:hypothetical protein